MPLDETTEKFLKSNEHCRFATIGKSDLFPHCVPVGYFYHHGMIYIPCNSKSSKARNVLKNSKSCVLVDTYERGIGRGVLLQGFATLEIEGYSRLKPMIELLTGWHLENWELGNPPKNKVDAIIQFEPLKIAIIGQLL